MPIPAGVSNWAFEPLTPTSFLTRTAKVHPHKVAVIDGDLSFTYEQLEMRALCFAGSLSQLAKGRPVAVLAVNSHVLLESHFSIPWSGSPLVALNTRLNANELAWIIEHSESCALIYTAEFEEVATSIATRLPRVVMITAGGPGDQYEAMVAAGSALRVPIDDERGVISINYTSGTTGQPKGVMYHHRGAYLQALAMVIHGELKITDVLLWTLPMFHCNGWCFPWAATAAGATHVCLRRFDAMDAWDLIKRESISLFCGAPTVLTMMANAESAVRVPRPVRVFTGGSAPTPAIIRRMEELGIAVTHLYGLTESFGPVMLNDWDPMWDSQSQERRAILMARQGVGNVIALAPRVVDPTGRDVPADATSVGEIALRGNDLMLGYLKDPDATNRAIPDGWFRTGDLGVRHPDGYIELRDRAKDVIISGGENISSVEVEAVLAEHPSVVECAIVAGPDEFWGEIPVAFVTTIDGLDGHEAELISWVRDRLAHFKAPRRVIFGPLPKTSTGKIQKFALRESARVALEKGAT